PRFQPPRRGVARVDHPTLPTNRLPPHPSPRVPANPPTLPQLPPRLHPPPTPNRQSPHRPRSLQRAPRQLPPRLDRLHRSLLRGGGGTEAGEAVGMRVSPIVRESNA